jgi:DNA processing protein
MSREEGRDNIASDEGVAVARLVAVPGLGPVAVGRLLAAFGSGLASLERTPEEWAVALGCAPCRAERCLTAARKAEVASQLEEASRLGAAIVSMGDSGYPPLLRAIHDPPPLLWVTGALEPVDDWALAIVGSRRCSAYGLDQAGRLARGLAQRGHTIVSGGARGIDAEAHRSTLRAGGRTIAVLGSGLACPYPPEHSELFAEIAASGGAVVSEHPPTTEPRSGFFPRRNRIIAGLALGVVLVEARARSGAAITARLSVEDHGREAFALPGRVDSPTSEGSHRAIREGWAALVTSVDDVVEQLRLRGPPGHLVEGARMRAPSGDSASGFDALRASVHSTCPTSGPLVDLGVDARRLGQRLVDHGRMQLFDLVALEVKSGCESSAVLAQLTLLEIAGFVRRDADGYWEARAPLLRELGSAG